MDGFDLRRVKWGDIFLCELDKVNGSVESGRRPVVIIQTNKLNYSSPTVTVAVITSAIKATEMKNHVVIGKKYGLKRQSMIMLEQMMTIDKSESFISYIGRVTDNEDVANIKIGLRYQFGLMRKPAAKRKALIMCLCPKCRQEFFMVTENIVRRLDPFQVEKEICDKCQVGYGYDYMIMKKYSRKDKI